MLAVEEPQQPNLPTTERYIRSPGDHAELLHGGGRGLATIAVNYPSAGWEEATRPVEEIPALADKFAGIADVYISMNRFRRGSRRTENLASLLSFYADLDYKDVPELRGRRARDVYRLVAAYLAEQGIPPPTLVVASGRGLHLVWRFHPVKRSALPRWAAAEDHLVQTLQRYGADPAATDPARVLRVVGTRNGFAEVKALGPVGEVYEFSDLADAILPYTQAEIRDMRVYEAAYRDARDSRPQRPHKPRGGAPEGYGGRSLWEERLRDLRDLRGLRSMDDGRARWICIAAVGASWVADSPQAMQAECRRLAGEVAGWSSRRTERDLGTVVRKMEAAYRGEKVFYGGHEVDPRYTYSSERIIRLLEITPGEQRHLRTLISDDERRRRGRERGRERRRAAGAEPRAAYEGRARERATRARELSVEGCARAEIAAVLGVSKPSVTGYLKQPVEGGSKSVPVSCAPRSLRGAEPGIAIEGDSKLENASEPETAGRVREAEEGSLTTTPRAGRPGTPSGVFSTGTGAERTDDEAGSLDRGHPCSVVTWEHPVRASEPGLSGGAGGAIAPRQGSPITELRHQHGEPPAGEDGGTASDTPSIADIGDPPSPHYPSRRTIFDWSAAQGIRAAGEGESDQGVSSGPRQPAETITVTDPGELHYRRLVRHLKGRVTTPSGEGELWQVFRDRAGILLDTDRSRVAFMPPGEVTP